MTSRVGRPVSVNAGPLRHVPEVHTCATKGKLRGTINLQNRP
jgi:hypothetical protein